MFLRGWTISSPTSSSARARQLQSISCCLLPNANCNAGGGECAEFVSGALQAGGFKTCFNTWVPTLDSCLKSHGWRKGTFPGAAGSVVIWTDSEGPYHTALSLGNGNIDQHNPYRCGTNGSWGTNYVLNPPDYIEANSTVTV